MVGMAMETPPVPSTIHKWIVGVYANFAATLFLQEPFSLVLFPAAAV